MERLSDSDTQMQQPVTDTIESCDLSIAAKLVAVVWFQLAKLASLRLSLKAKLGAVKRAKVEL